MAPELLTKNAFRSQEIEYSGAVDTFAFGVICWEVLCLDRAWGNTSFSSAIMDKVLAGERLPIPTTWIAPMVGPPAGFVDLMGVCWHQDPAMRPKFKNILHGLGCILEKTTQWLRQWPTAASPQSDDEDTTGSSLLVPASPVSMQGNHMTLQGGLSNGISKTDAFEIELPSIGGTFDGTFEPTE